MARLRSPLEGEALIRRLVEQELASPAPAAVQAIAETARRDHGNAVMGVLFYGSALRDADPHDTLIDLYLIVDRYANAHANRLSAICNRLLPPNVYYAECDHDGRCVRAKYAVVSLDQLGKLVMPGTLNPYFWARFAQPTGLFCCNDASVRDRVTAIMVQATLTMMTAVAPLVPGDRDGRTFWTTAFAQTYATELRAEKPNRAIQLYERFADRYDQLTLLATDRVAWLNVGAAPNRWAGFVWRCRRLQGKTLSVLRLLKAAFTFRGGADYLVWKITRHSGVEIELTDWQRRHPILAAPPLLWRLRRLRAVR